MLERICLVDFCSGQTLQILKKRISESCILSPIFRQQFLRPSLNHYDCYRNHRNAYQKDNRAWEIDNAQNSEQSQRRQHRIKELRQIRPKIRFQLFHAFHGNLHDFRSICLLLIGRTKSQKLLINHLAKRFLYQLGGKITHLCRDVRTHKPHTDRHYRNDCRQRQFSSSCISFVQMLQHLCNRGHHGNIGY